MTFCFCFALYISSSSDGRGRWWSWRRSLFCCPYLSLSFSLSRWRSLLSYISSSWPTQQMSKSKQILGNFLLLSFSSQFPRAGGCVRAVVVSAHICHCSLILYHARLFICELMINETRTGYFLFVF